MQPFEMNAIAYKTEAGLSDEFGAFRRASFEGLDATETTDAAPAHVDARNIAADRYLAAAKPVKQ